MMSLTIKQLLRPTPLLILSAITLVVIFYEFFFQTSAGREFRYPLMKHQLVFFAEMMVLDVLIKFISQNKNYLLWSLQILACLGILYYWIVT